MINSEWMMVGDAKRPSEHRGPKFPLLRHKDGRYVLVVDDAGTMMRVSTKYGKQHDQVMQNEARRRAAKLLGAIRSPAKAAAARRNGAKGGRPRAAANNPS